MEDVNNITTSSSTLRNDTNPRERFCVDCHTTKTPMWRGGPSGPRSLCNACGIKFRKKNKGVLSSGRWGSKKSEKNTNIRREDEVTTLMDRRLMSSNDRKRLREEEEAAILLMHLSCGSVYA